MPPWRSLLDAVRKRPSWVTAALVTIIAAMVGSAYVGWLAFFPPAIDDVSLAWPFFDKRWILALDGLALALVFLFPVARRLCDVVKGPTAVAPAVTSPVTAARSWRARLGIAICLGFLLAAIDVAPQIPEGLTKTWGPHELVHLGPLQQIAHGAAPYVGARTQYGPGHQFISFLLMRKTEFTLYGFRASFFALNILAEGVVFSALLYCLGWGVGLAAILFSRLFCPVQYLGFIGWFVELRWCGPLLVGLALSRLAWGGSSFGSSLRRIAAIGVAGGLLAWISQENLSTVLVTGGLILGAGFARGLLSTRELIASFALFAACHVLTFCLLLGALVGVDNLAAALNACFATGVLWAEGLANTSWTSAGSPWTRAFYLTPAVVIILNAAGSWAPAQRDARAERKLMTFVAVAAAAASLVPITLLRSDEPHFVGPSSAALPILVLLAVLVLPGLLSTRIWLREAIRAALFLALAWIYVAPQAPAVLIARLDVDRAGVREGIVSLSRVGMHRPDMVGASFFEHRLGFRVPAAAPPPRMAAGSRCNVNFTVTCGDMIPSIDDVRTKIGGRTVFVDARAGAPSSMMYFFADLTGTIATPELDMTVWTRKDLQRLRVDLVKHPPDCMIVYDDQNIPVSLREVLGKYETIPLRAGNAYCRN